MEPGWHIYWQNPGDSGVPTEVSWKAPPGFRLLQTMWTRPERIDAAGIVSYGLQGEAAVIATFQVPPNAKSFTLKASADWLICQEICLEGKGSAELKLPVRKEKPPVRSAFSRLAALLPQPGTGLRFEASSGKEQYELMVRPFSAPPIAATRAYFYPYSDELANHSAPQSFLAQAGGFKLSIPRSRFEKGTATRLRGILEIGFASNYHSAFVVDAPIQTTGSQR